MPYLVLGELLCDSLKLSLSRDLFGDKYWEKRPTAPVIVWFSHVLSICLLKHPEQKQQHTDPTNCRIFSLSPVWWVKNTLTKLTQLTNVAKGYNLPRTRSVSLSSYCKDVHRTPKEFSQTVHRLPSVDTFCKQALRMCVHLNSFKSGDIYQVISCQRLNSITPDTTFFMPLYLRKYTPKRVHQRIGRKMTVFWFLVFVLNKIVFRILAIKQFKICS